MSSAGTVEGFGFRLYFDQLPTKEGWISDFQTHSLLVLLIFRSIFCMCIFNTIYLRSKQDHKKTNLQLEGQVKETSCISSG